jgi:hypothetical protein
MSIEKFVDYTQILNKDYRILLFDVKLPHPTPLQWTFVINEFNENIRVLKNLGCKFAFILNVKIIGMISTEYIMEFINLLKSNTELLESKLISTSVIYEGVLINKMFDIIKLFYKTKKPLEFCPDMRKAIEYIELHNN